MEPLFTPFEFDTDELVGEPLTPELMAALSQLQQAE
jgi:hypothetical protein